MWETENQLTYVLALLALQDIWKTIKGEKQQSREGKSKYDF